MKPEMKPESEREEYQPGDLKLGSDVRVRFTEMKRGNGVVSYSAQLALAYAYERKRTRRSADRSLLWVEQ